MDAGENGSPHIELIEPETDLDTKMAIKSPHIELIEPETDIYPLLYGTEKPPELVEHQYIPTIDL